MNVGNKESIDSLINKYVIKKDEKVYGDCLKYYYSRLKDASQTYSDLKSFLIGIRDVLIQTNYIDISATNEEDSYTIFEILNARGMELEDHELIKNFIMRYILPESKVDEVRMRWNYIESELGTQINRFFSHYTAHRFVTSNKQSMFRTIQNNVKKTEVQDLFEDILLKMKYYKKIISPIKEGNDKNCNPTEYEVFTFLKSRRAEQFRPLLLSLMHVREENLITESKYNETLIFIYTFFICFNIIGQLKSNSLEDTLARYTRLIENKFDLSSIEDLQDSLKSKLPTQSVFISNFKTIGWSHKHDFYKDARRKSNVQTVLELIEKHVSNIEIVPTFTIEHILDDANSVNNAQVGNLLPIEERLNLRCSGKSFEEKMEIYKESNFKMTRNFAVRYEGKHSIDFKPESRAEYMAKQIYKDILGLSI